MAKLTNIEKIRRQIRKIIYSFDSTRREAPDEKYYFSYMFPLNFARRYYNGKLNIKDLLNLDNDQLNEFSVKFNYVYAINFDGINDDQYNRAIKYFGVKKFVELYNSNAEQVLEIMKNFSCFISAEKKFLSNLQACRTAQEALDLSQLILYSEITEQRYPMKKAEEYSALFKAKYPQLFPSTENLPADLVTRFKHRRLSYEDIVLYAERFSDINIDKFTEATISVNGFKMPGAEAFKNLVLQNQTYFKKTVSLGKGKIPYQFLDSIYNLLEESRNKEGFDLNLEFKKAAYKDIVGQNTPYSEDLFQLVLLYYEYCKGVIKDAVFDISTPKELLEDQLKKVIYKRIVHQSIPYSEELFQIILLYGERVCLDYHINFHEFDISASKELLEEQFRMAVYNCITKDKAEYSADMPESFISAYPELFISDEAPDVLKRAFYSRVINPSDIYNPEYNNYLGNMNLRMLLSNNGRYAYFFNLFGEEKSLILIKRSAGIIEKMEGNIDLMHEWYKKSGETFLPHNVIMTSFPIDQADKFFSSGKKWSRLMRIPKYNELDEYKAALLAASMVFGVFDGDDKGFNQIINLISGLPKEVTIDSEKINSMGFSRELFLRFYTPLSVKDKYALIVNPQLEKEESAILRGMLEEAGVESMITPQKAHQIFGSFQMKYDPEFRDFFMRNIGIILESEESWRYIGNIQKRFSEIVRMNSNKVLTLDLAVAYVVSHSFNNIEKGNEHITSLIGASGYGQADFEALQTIYNYGRTRTFSSIPRIEFNAFDYHCEILRLDDPVALVIGNLTNCCQELDDAAETSMIHSATSKNGRVFVIKDQDGNVIAQSWVWRNGQVLCFDNIEVPSKAIARGKAEGKSLASIIFDLYKKAASDLLIEDEKIYKRLLEEGKITQEQYQNLRLTMVTVGLGFNDIAEELKNRAHRTVSPLHPLEVKNIIEYEKHKGLYTSDSREQYVLAGEDKPTALGGSTLAVYTDDFPIYSDSNIPQEQKRVLASITDMQLIVNSSAPINAIAGDLDSKLVNIKAIIIPNLAIIFSDGEEIKIIGINVAVPKLGEEEQNAMARNQTLLQLKLAINQLKASGKSIDVSILPSNQLELYNEAIGISEEQVDSERGILNGK